MRTPPTRRATLAGIAERRYGALAPDFQFRKVGGPAEPEGKLISRRV
jgi:hypothetical protein